MAKIQKIFSGITVWAALAVLLLVALLLSLTGLARSPAARDFVKRELSTVIAEELGVRATFSDVDLVPQSFAVVARGISLDHPTGGRLLDAAELAIRPSWRALLRGRLDLNVVSVDRASLWLRIRDGKLINAPELPETGDDTGGELDLPLNYFSLQHARVVVDAGPELQAEIASIDVWVDATREGEIGLRADVGSGSLTHPEGEERLHHAMLRASLSADRLAVAEAVVRTADVEARVAAAELQFPLLETPFGGDVDLTVQLPALARLPQGLDLPELSGQLQVSGTVLGQNAEQLPNIEAEVALSRVYIDQFGIGERVTAQVSASAEKIAWDAVFAAVDNGGELDLSGEIDLSDAQLAMRTEGQARGVEFAKLMKQLGVTDNAIVDWRLNGQLALSGPLSPLDLRGELHFDTRDLRVTQDAYHERPRRHILHLSRADLDGGVRVTEAGIQFLEVDATLPRSRVEVTEVLLGFDNSLLVDAQGVGIDLRDVSPLLDFDLDGQGGFDIKVVGSFTDPAVSGNAGFKRFAFAGFPFGDLSTQYRLVDDSQAVRFTDVVIHKNASRYHTDDLYMDFRGGRLLIDSQLQLDPLAVADFYHIFHYDQDERFASYQGLLTGGLDVRYTLDYPGDGPSGTLKIGMDLQLPEVSLDGYQFVDGEFQGAWDWYDNELGYEGGVLTVDRLAMHKGAGTVHVSGRMARGGKLDFVVLADSLSIRDTEGLGDKVPGLAGRYGITGRVEGLLSAPRAHLDLLGFGLRFNGAPLGDSRAYVRLSDKEDPWVKEALNWPAEGPLPRNTPCAYARRGLARGVWEPDPPLRVAGGFETALDRPMAWLLCGSALGGQVGIDLAIGRTKVLPLRGRLRMNNLAYGHFIPRFAEQGALRGQAAGYVEFSGGAAAVPETLAGELRLDNVQAGQFSVSLRNDGPVWVQFGEGRLDVRRALFRGPASHLRVQGGGSVRGGLSLTVAGSMDLSLLTHVSNAVEDVSGRLQLQFNVAGPVDAPKVYGNAQVSNAGFRVDALPTPVANINGSVVFSEHRVLIENFRGQLASGELNVQGSASLAGRGLGSYRLSMEAEGMRLRPKEGIEIGFGGRTTLAWQEGERLPLLSGVLRLDRMYYGRDIQVGRSLQDMYRTERREVTTYTPDGDFVAIDLELVQGQPLRVENNLIEADFVLDTSKQPFRLVGTNQRFGVLGNMSARRGILRFRDTTFDIRDGEFRFRDPLRISPTFDLRAVTDVRRKGRLGQDQWHISLHAWGSEEEFRWELASDPHLSEDDIALMLTVGMTHAELAQLETGELTSTAALEALATVTGVEREVKRALPTIDEFRVQSAYSQNSNRTEPQVYIGKRIADRVRLSAATGVGESRDFRTGVELQVSDQTSVQGVYNNQNASSASQLGDVGVDLKWRLEFD